MLQNHGALPDAALAPPCPPVPPHAAPPAQHWLPDEELDAIMAKYDADGNGVIDQEEFIKIVSAAVPMA